MFNVLIEIVTLIWQAVSGLLYGFIIRIPEWFPVLQELKQTFSYCAPIGMWALFFGVSAPLLALVAKVVNFAFSKSNN